MKVNLSILFENAPEHGRIKAEQGRLLGGTLMVGWGQLDTQDYHFELHDTTQAHLTFALEVEASETEQVQTVVRVLDTPDPFSFPLRDVLLSEDGSMPVPDHGVTVRAERDWWADL